MLFNPATVAPHRDAPTLAAPVWADRASACPVPSYPPVVGDKVTATPAAGGASNTNPASPAPVLTSAPEAMSAFGISDVASQATARRHRWIISLRHRLSQRSDAPRRSYPPRRPAYLERAAMARAMERL